MATSLNKLTDKLNLEKLGIGKSKREKMLLTLLILMFVLVGYFYIFFKPTMSRLMSVLPKLSSLDADVKSAKSDIENRALLESRKVSLQAKIDYYEKRLPSQKEIPKLLESLSGIAIKSGVKIIGIRPVENLGDQAKGAKEDIYQEIPIRVTAICGYHQLGEFIQKLESADRFLKISDVRIEANPSSTTRHDVKLLIATYTLTKAE